MPRAKVAVTLDRMLLDRLDSLVRQERFANRSRAIEVALEEKLERLSHARLARECAKLDRREEQSLADEGLGTELDAWPEY